MSPQLQSVFMSRIAPAIEKTVRRFVTPQAGEDVQDLVQDALVDACAAADSLERRGRKVVPQSVVYYTVQRARAGRRAMNAGRTDVYSAGTQIAGRAVLLSLDAPFDPDDPDPASACLHDVLASRRDDPASEAIRRLDWGGFAPRLNEQQQKVLQATARGDSGVEQGVALKVSAARVVQVKREIAEQARGYWGSTVLADAGTKPAWRRDVEQRRAA